MAYHYVIVRADLPRGLQAAQIVHAAGVSSPGNLPAGTHAVVLTAVGEADLRRLADALDGAGVRLARIYEPVFDTRTLTERDELMAIGLYPIVDRREVRRFTSMLPLLR